MEKMRYFLHHIKSIILKRKVNLKLDKQIFYYTQNCKLSTPNYSFLKVEKLLMNISENDSNEKL